MAYYLIRHGETSWNKDNRIQGWTDISLSEYGLKQASVLALALKHIPIHAVYSSDLLRAYQTAQAYESMSGHKAVLDPMLREIHFGAWEGKTWQEIIDENKDVYASGLYDDPDNRIHQGESMNMFKKRAANHFLDIVKKHPNEDIVLFTHGGNIRMIILEILNKPIDFKNHIQIDNASITVIDQNREGNLNIVKINDTAHLKSWNL